MKKEQAPQDLSKTYGGKRKLLYVTNDNGEYDTVTSDGWEVEEIVNSMALQQLEEQAKQASNEVKQGISSPLLYWMYQSRMDTAALAQAMGLFQWQVKRHFKPKVFKRLKTPLLQRYANILGISINDLINYDPN